jgi:hypothetical protein
MMRNAGFMELSLPPSILKVWRDLSKDYNNHNTSNSALKLQREIIKYTNREYRTSTTSKGLE